MYEKVQAFWRIHSMDYERLLQVCREGLAISPLDREELLHNETMALYLLDRYDESIARCKEIIPTLKDKGYIQSVSNTLHTCLQKRGIELAQKGKSEEAFLYLKEAVKMDTVDEMVHYCLGLLYQNQGDPLMAMHHYIEALKLQPDFPEVYNNIAVMIFNEEGDIKAAIKNIEIAFTQNPSTDLLTKMYMSLIRLYKQIANYDQQEYYNAKLLQLLGFPTTFDNEEDDI